MADVATADQTPADPGDSEDGSDRRTPSTSSAETAPDAPRFGGGKILVGVFAMMISMTLLAIVLPSLVLRADERELEVYGDMPAFELRDHTGAAISDSRLRGNVVVANFIFTRCPTVCPMMTARMYQVQEQSRDIADDLKLISFTVDPDHDTPEVLAEYAADHRTDSARWRFITGDSETIRAMVNDGFALVMERRGTTVTGVPDISHAEHFVLLDRSGRIRGYYDSNDAKRVSRMLRDARRLAIRTR